MLVTQVSCILFSTAERCAKSSAWYCHTVLGETPKIHSAIISTDITANS
jgi:hypothetical protein